MSNLGARDGAQVAVGAVVGSAERSVDLKWKLIQFNTLGYNKGYHTLA